MRTGSAVVAVACAIAMAVAVPAGASVVLGENFESGAAGWTMDGLWHVQANPEAISVAPDIDPSLVTLPDAGSLPSAAGGTHAAWYGEASSGTFCADHTSVSQTPKNGCRTSSSNSGRLVSPSFSLVGAESAQLVFSAWWEIEAVNADAFDLMKVQYSVGGGAWTDVGSLNPVDNPAGEHDESYSNNGLRTSPSWQTYVASLGDAIGASDVRIAFRFDTVDSQYQGFRGWLIDDVSVSTPFTEAGPQIAALEPSCVSPVGADQVVALTGSGFVLGSTLTLDGASVPGAATLSSTRMEFHVSNPAPGNHTVQVHSPLGVDSNTVTLTSAGNCGAPPPPPPVQQPPADRRATATQVVCNRGPEVNAKSECIATVGDADAPPRTTPTGTVSFTTSTGAFGAGSTCQLKATPSSPGVASCSQTYTPPPAGGFPAVTATYEGDATHVGSSGSTSFIIAAPPGSEPTTEEAPDPSECAGVLAGARSKGATARIYREAARVPSSQRGVGFCLWYMGATGFRHGINLAGQGGTLVVGTVVGVGAPVVGTMAGFEAGPVGGVIGGVTGAAITKEYVIPATTGTMKAIGDAQQRALQDPPDPEFKVVVRPERPRVARLTPRKGLGRRAARALTAYVREQVRVRELAAAVAATIDKAGGARLAGDEKWFGVQTRAYVRFSKHLAVGLDRLAERQELAAKRAKRSRLLSKPMATRKQVARRLQRTAKRGFTKREERALRSQVGLSKEQIGQVRTFLGGVDPEAMPRSVADLLANETTLEAYRVAAESFRLLVQLPAVHDDAASPGSTASTTGPRVAGKAARLARGRIALELRCGATASGPCRGALQIRLGAVVIGRGTFEVAEEGGAEVSVEPTRRGRRALARGRRHRVDVVLDPADGPELTRRIVIRG